MGILMHLDEYVARCGVVPDDTAVNGDPYAIFDGKVEHDDKSRQDLKESERRLEEAESTILDMLDDQSRED